VKKTLLAIGPAGNASGFGRVFTSLLPSFAGSYRVTHFAPNLSTELRSAHYRVLARQAPGDVYGREALSNVLREVDPDVVLLCNDLPFWSVHREALLRHKAANRGRPICIYYCPIEWKGQDVGALQTLADVDFLVLYTEFGRQVATEAFKGVRPPPMSVIPHGLDLEAFCRLAPDRPIECREAARRWLLENGLAAGAPVEGLDRQFIVLNANRNSPRKQVHLTLEGFAHFAEQKRDVWLYLHMGLFNGVYGVRDHAHRLKIADRILLTQPGDDHPSVSDEALNHIYNACDVGLNTSSGEGWGLVSMEHAATGAPQVVPEHSACAELWSGRGLCLPVEENMVRPEDVAAALERLYRSPSLRQELGAAGMRFARQDGYRWTTVARRWLQLFRDLQINRPDVQRSAGALR
jgi:glycosyltransferase involved in cell wall biosynthesis